MMMLTIMMLTTFMLVTIMLKTMMLTLYKVWTSGVVSSHFRLGWLAATFILLRFHDEDDEVMT